MIPIQALHMKLQRRFRPSFLEPVAAAIRADLELNDSIPIKVAVSLAARADDMQSHLRSGHLCTDVMHSAWSARNLLEIQVWSLFVSQSIANALRFQRDSLLDTISVAKAGKALAESAISPGLSDSEKETVQRMYAQLLEDTHASDDDEKARFLDVGKTADLVGLGAQFRFLNKFASKFVHATAYSVMCPPRAPFDRQLCDVLFLNGGNAAVQALDTISRNLTILRVPVAL